MGVALPLICWFLIRFPKVRSNWPNGKVAMPAQTAVTAETLVKIGAGGDHPAPVRDSARLAFNCSD
jgi:hypothetical protein